MAYGRDTYGFQQHMSATFVPGVYDDFSYNPPPAPELVAPEPQRINPEMSSQIADGIAAVKALDLNSQGQRRSQYATSSRANDEPTFSPFPKLVNPPPNVPPSDAELEATLENARTLVLNSNDPEMQLAWAADALVYVGVCADNEERTTATKAHTARPATPRIEHTLKVDAMNIVSFLAEQHHPKAEFLKGMWLEWGRFGQREDKKEAFRCYSRAADRGYARAEYRIGMLYESYNDPVKALRHYYKGVDAGDAASCYRLGMMTLRGQHGQQQDYAKAVDLIRKSANAADENAAQGAYVYGMLLARQLPQINIPEGILALDEQQARMNIEKAAYLKFAKAQLKMGSCYELAAMGCDFNPALSMHYNALAAKQGEAEADMALSKWFLVGSEGLFPKNEELAYTYAERAAQNGLATAEFALGYFNEIGVYVPVNIDKALEWYQKASKHGNADATGRIEGLSRKQTLSRKDHEKVAVSKIKSQHGSMRGARPDRFRQPQTPRLGQVAERPEPSYSQSQSQNGTVAQAPARGRTPYPEDDRPPIVPPANSKPASVTPYPLDNGPPTPSGSFINVQQPLPRPATALNADVRPSSAFQLNPELRPSSAAAPAQIPHGGAPQQYNNAPLRPVAGPGPRPQPAALPYDARTRPPVGNRIASGPATLQQNPNYPPQQQPSQSTGMKPSPLNPQRPFQPDPNAAKADLGYTAPPDDQRRRQYGPTRPNQDVPRPQHASTMPSNVNPAAKPSPRIPSGGTSTQDPRPQSAGRLTAASAASKVSSAVPPVPKPSATHTSTAPPPSQATKPGKGPKTFDEMGVPASKGDGDCVIM